MSSKDKIIILRAIPHGDSDLVIHGLNTQGMKLGLFAKSALKSVKRFGGGVLQPSHFVQVVFREKPGLDVGLGQLQEACLLEPFRGLRQDFDRLNTALHLLKLVGRISLEGDLGSKELFLLVGHTLRALETSQDLPALQLQFEIKLIAHLGILPLSPEMVPLLQEPMKNHAAIMLGEENIPHLRALVARTWQEYLG